jgi:membrane protein DedA with SNARE-associated domain
MIKKILLYCLVYIACLFEGETALTTSAFAAHRGYLKIFGVMIIALAATQTWDWFWFTLGRRKGREFLEKKPGLYDKALKINNLLGKYPVPLLLGYRFLFGFRTAVPLVIGMSSVSKQKFLTFSLINTILWDTLFSSAGYFFGAILEANWKRIEYYEFEIMGGIIFLGIISGLFLRYKSLRRVALQSEIISRNE